MQNCGSCLCLTYWPESQRKIPWLSGVSEKKEECRCLIFLGIFPHVENNSGDNNHTLKHLLEVRRNFQQHHAVFQDAEDQDARDNAGYPAHAACMGSSANSCCRNRVQLIVQAWSLPPIA